MAIFRYWYEGQLAYSDYLPTWDEMRYSTNARLRFVENVQTYLQYVFNNTFNMGNSLEPYLAAVIYLARCNGVSLLNQISNGGVHLSVDVMLYKLFALTNRSSRLKSIFPTIAYLS